MTPEEISAVFARRCRCTLPRMIIMSDAWQFQLCSRCDAPPNQARPPLYSDPATWERRTSLGGG